MSLQLRSFGGMANTCLLVGHARKADVVWTREQFMVLCEHLLNQNSREDFLLVFPRPAGDFREPYAKSKRQCAQKRARWAWDYITGRAKAAAGIGFYPTNPERKSRWGAMDFDSHDGNVDRARNLAIAAFHLLLKQPELFLILCTSGGGWHLFALTVDFYPTDEWTRLFRQVADFLGCPVQKGVLEIFPDDGSGMGRAIRAPGTFNPKRSCFSEIIQENISSLLDRLCRGERDSPFLNLSTHWEKKAKLTEQAKKLCETALRDFAITKPATRHDQLKALVSQLYRFHSRQAVHAIAVRQFAAKAVHTNATVEQHLSEFEALWTYWIKRYQGRLNAKEKEKEALLETESEKEAFRLAWGFANLEPNSDFAYSSAFFSRALGITVAGACKQRNKFCQLGILKQTVPFVANCRAARFKWLAAQ